jgi:hypothetical protein
MQIGMDIAPSDPIGGTSGDATVKAVEGEPQSFSPIQFSYWTSMRLLGLLLAMPLKYVPNTLDDAAHALLDQAVLNMAEALLDQAVLNMAEDGPPPPLILLTIISTSKGLLDPKYNDAGNATALLKGYPELRDKLKAAWAARSFKEIRNLGVMSI